MSTPSGSFAEKWMKRCTLLTNGYCHQIQKNIPLCIIGICFDYYFIKEGNVYEWKITDPVKIQEMKTANPGERYDSARFYFDAYPSLLWCLELYPNGSRTSKTGDVCIYLHLIKLSPKIGSIQLKRTYTFIESDISHSSKQEIDHDRLYAKDGHVVN